MTITDGSNQARGLGVKSYGGKHEGIVHLTSFVWYAPPSTEGRAMHCLRCGLSSHHKSGKPIAA